MIAKAGSPGLTVDGPASFLPGPKARVDAAIAEAWRPARQRRNESGIPEIPVSGPAAIVYIDLGAGRRAALFREAARFEKAGVF
jgi:hypothetical protein